MSLLAVSLDMSDGQGRFTPGVVGSRFSDNWCNGLRHANSLNVPDRSGWYSLKKVEWELLSNFKGALNSFPLPVRMSVGQHSCMLQRERLGPE